MTTREELNSDFDRLTASVMEIKKQRDSLALIARAVVAGMDEDPGHSDLDNEQPIHVCIPLGEYRRAKRLLYRIEHPDD